MIGTPGLSRLRTWSAAGKCPEKALRYDPAMPRRSPLPRAIALCLAMAPALGAQTPTPTPTPSPTTVASGFTLTTQNSRSVSGGRSEQRPDGTVWFLIPSNDRIVQLQPDGVTFKQWQI